MHKHTRNNFAAMLAMALGAAAADAAANVTLPSVFGSGAVLQRDRPVPVWGWAAPGEEVTVSFAGQQKKAVAGKDGKWTVKLDPLRADKKPSELVVAGSNKVTSANVVVGDVWLCAGQSNMKVSVADALQPEIEAAAANYPEIRHLAFGVSPADFPMSDQPASWSVCTPKSVLGFSAIAFFFARRLFEELDVPIGLINSTAGATPIEAWTPPAGYRSVPELKAFNALMDEWDVTTDAGNRTYRDYIVSMKAWLAEAKKAAAEKRAISLAGMPALPGRGKTKRNPTSLFNGMIHPLIPYAIRGVIWYQGGTNRGESDREYFLEMQALINGWRMLWQQGDFPFFFVQQTDFQQPNDKDPAGGDGWAPIREGARFAMSITNTGMAVTIDVGGSEDHPKNKQDVAQRLALWALAKTYGKNIPVYSGPLYKGCKVEGNRIRVFFDHCGSGLMFGDKAILPNLAVTLDPVKEVKDAKVKWVSIAGKDRQWQWAQMAIDGDTVLVWSDRVPDPVAVRYAYTHRPVGVKLYNKEGLPTSPFRTDDW